MKNSAANWKSRRGKDGGKKNAKKSEKKEKRKVQSGTTQCWKMWQKGTE
jgi:hypothetical protein